MQVFILAEIPPFVKAHFRNRANFPLLHKKHPAQKAPGAAVSQFIFL